MSTKEIQCAPLENIFKCPDCGAAVEVASLAEKTPCPNCGVLVIPKQFERTVLFDKTRASKAVKVINVGGSGSSKSHSIEQLLIEKLIEEKDKRIGISRKTMPELRRTAYVQMIDLLKEYGIYNERWHNKADNIYTHKPTGSSMAFFGLDEYLKIKSANFNYLWMEEANEFTYEDYTAFKLAKRRPSKDGKLNQLFLSLNPIDSFGWIPTRALKEKNIEIIHSVYKDNPFIDKETREELESLKNYDENKHKVYTLGEWGRLEGLIYKNWDRVDEVPDGGVWAYGLDFGLVSPSTLIKVTLIDREAYLEERFYEPMSISDIVARLTHEARGDIYADPTAKLIIQEINDAGFTCYEAVRDVKHSIDLCKRQTLHIHKDSTNLLKEVSYYQWKTDRDGKPEDKPVKYRDHACDAFRYAIYGLSTRYGFATAEPSGESVEVFKYA